MKPNGAVNKSEKDAKDFVEHIRTVHFTLLITAISLAIAAIHNRTSAVHQAAKDLEKIDIVRSYMASGEPAGACLCRRREARLV